MRQRRPLLFVAIGLLLVAVAVLLLWHARPSARAPAFDPAQQRLSAATVLDDKQQLPRFSLVRHGDPFDNTNLQGRWTLLYFGYTFCPDVCPTALLLLKELKVAVSRQGLPVPQVVLVSVDPQRDTPETLRNYTAAFDPEFVGVTGDDATLAGLVKHLGVHYLRHESGGKPNYVVDHSSAIYLIDPGGRLKAVFSPPQELQRMLGDYAKLTH